MSREWNVEVSLGLIGTLRKSARERQIEITVLIQNLEGFGPAAVDVAGYTTITGGRRGVAGAPDEVEFELKARGSWTPLVLRHYASGLLVLSDR